jgi:hypothetical protein
MFTEWAQRMRARGYPVEEALGGIMGEDAWRLVDSPATYEAIRNKVATDAALEAMIDDVARKNGEIIFVLHEGVSKDIPLQPGFNCSTSFQIPISSQKRHSLLTGITKVIPR